MSASDSHHDAATPSWFRRQEEILDRFESAWDSTQPPRLDDFIPADGEPDRGRVLQELIRADLEFRLRRGEAVCVETYMRRYSELEADRSAMLALIRAEIELRRTLDPRFRLDGVAWRFPEYATELATLLKELAPVKSRPSGLSTADDYESRATPLPNIATRSVGKPELAVDDYELLTPLGRGARGVVYKARQIKLDRLVALKIIPSIDHSESAKDLPENNFPIWIPRLHRTL